jgi:methylthioribose-1-phosphate isomerase
MLPNAPYRSVAWRGGTDGVLRLLDQTLLPETVRYLDITTVEAAWEAIRALRVRGAPAIGVTAAYAVVVGMQTDATNPTLRLRQIVDYLRTSRPTAVNLFWALDRMHRAAAHLSGASAVELRDRLLAEARAIHAEDEAMCRAIGEHGSALFSDGQGVLTHCNTGGLATSILGTALACIISAVGQGKKLHVFADETRPLLQGARLTTWELQHLGIPVTLICDNMAGQVMREGRVHAAIVGADRIAANGDTANKIGTYGVAVLCQHHGIPFYVAAPSSTFDLSLATGAQIPIEQRDPREITHGFGQATAPQGIDVYNPAFDVTPADLITAIVTERGVVMPVNKDTIRWMLAA